MQVMRAVVAGVYEVRKFLPKLWRMAQELFHEVMGFVFFALTLFFIFGRQGLIRSYQDLESEPGGWGRLLVVGFFVLLFGGFGMSSFLRAKRISRRGREPSRER